MRTVTITQANFDSEVLKSKVPVLVDFWAAWCGPCRMVAPVLEEIAGEVEKVKIGKINVDEENELAVRYNVMSIPTLALFKNGKVIKTIIGAKPKAEILKLVELG